MQSPADGKKVARADSGPLDFKVPVVLGFFLLFFLYVGLRIQPVAEYYSENSVFSLTSAFFDRIWIVQTVWWNMPQPSWRN